MYPLRSALLLMCLAVCRLGIGQTELDSLRTAAATTTGIAKVDALNRFAFRLILSDPKRAEEITNEAVRLSHELAYQKGVAEALVYQGLCQQLRSSNGLPVIKKGISSAEKIGEKGIEGYGWIQIGNLYRNKSKFDSAQVAYSKAYMVLRDSAHAWQLSVLYRNLARYYALQYDTKREFKYLMRSLAIRQYLSDKVLQTDIYLLLSKWHLEQSNATTAKQYLTLAEKNAPADNVVEIRKLLQYQRANLLFRDGNYTDALKLLQEVKEFYFSINNIQQYCSLLLDLAEVLEELGNFDISLKNSFDAAALAEKNGYLQEQMRGELLIARNYYRIKQTAQAAKFAAKALAAAEKNNFKFEQATALNLRGLILKAEKKYDLAITQFQDALTIRQTIGDKKGIGTTLANIGECYEGLGNLKQALAIHFQSLQIKDSISHQSGLAWTYFDLANTYAKLRDAKNAINYLEKAEKKSRQIKSGVILASVYKVRRDLYQSLGQNEEALKFSIMYESLNDSILNTSLTNRIMSMQSAYELDQKSQEIELLNKTQQLQRDQIALQKSRIRQQEIIIISSIIGLALLAALAYISYIFFKRTTKLNLRLKDANQQLHIANRTLSEKQEEIQAQAEELTEANTSLTHLNKELAEKTEELAAQSEELRESNELITHLNQNLEEKVALRTRELTQAYQELDTFFYRSSHDFRRPLTTFMGLAEVAKITVKDENALNLFDKVRDTAVNLDRMLMKLQSISNVGVDQLNFKKVLIHTEVYNSIDTYKNELRQTNFQVDVQVPDDLEIVSYATFIKIILDNVIENAIKFRSRIPQLKVHAMRKDGGILITVSDNGIGVEEVYKARVFEMFFRGSELSKGNGLGLYIVKRAVERLKGMVHFYSEYQKGSAVTIWLPQTAE